MDCYVDCMEYIRPPFVTRRITATQAWSGSQAIVAPKQHSANCLREWPHLMKWMIVPSARIFLTWGIIARAALRPRLYAIPHAIPLRSAHDIRPSREPQTAARPRDMLVAVAARIEPVLASAPGTRGHSQAQPLTHRRSWADVLAVSRSFELQAGATGRSHTALQRSRGAPTNLAITASASEIDSVPQAVLRTPFIERGRAWQRHCLWNRTRSVARLATGTPFSVMGANRH